ncbi:MAG TPA: nuclear transport factor 2 family protein [Sphingomicrobium sp.]|jgi:hypothetical protein|nr:nuclear transport factor 2 family protein [Sphingomicrobium sp.]
MAWTFAAALLLVSSAAPAASACPSEPRTQVGVLLAEQRWVEALERRDTRALDCILDESFADTSWRGQLIQKAQMMKALAGRPQSTLKLSDLTPQLIGDVAIVRGINTRSQGSNVVGSVRFVDVFVYRSGRWQAVSAQESLIETAHE